MKKHRTILFIFLIYIMSMDFGYAQWDLVFNPVGDYVRIQCFADMGTKLFGGTLNGGVYFTADNANTEWPSARTGLTDTNVRVIGVNEGNLFAGTAGGVFLSTNEGANWVAVNNGLTNLNVQTLVFSGSKLFVGTFGGIFLSSDNGANWNPVNNGLTSLAVSSLVVKGSNIFAGTVGYFGGGVFISSDNGANWNLVNNGLTNTIIQSLTVCGTTLFAVIQGATVFASTNDGVGWIPANSGLPSTFELHLTSSGTNLFAGTYGSGIYLSTNYGTTWSEVNSPYGPTYISTVGTFGSYLFAAHFNGDVYRRSLSEMVTSSPDTKDSYPMRYSLEQNYPNPFNPATVIRYQLPANSYVTLKVFDVLGREIATLVNEDKKLGSYEVEFDGSKLPSSVYFYRLQAGSFVETKKLLLMK